MKKLRRERVLGRLFALAFVLFLADSPEPLQALGGWRVEVVEEAVRLRSAPDTGSAVIAMLHRGDVLDVRSWSPAVWAVRMTDEPASFAAAFWIRAVDASGHEGWIASPLVLPVNAWPKEPWIIGQLLPSCSGGTADPVPGRLYLDVLEVFEHGVPISWPNPSENPDGWKALVDSVSRTKWVQLLGQDGGYRWAEALGPGVTCEPCSDGLGHGPSIAAIDGPKVGSLAVGRKKGISGYQRLYSSGGLLPFLFLADHEQLLALLGRFQGLADLELAGLRDLQCSPPLSLWEHSTQRAKGVWECQFFVGTIRWQLLLGIEWEEGRAIPWLARLSAQTRFEPRDAERLDEYRDRLGADVASSAKESFVSDLNEDGTLELWFRTHVWDNEYGAPGWEVYFIRDGVALGPWFVLGGGEASCD